MKQLLLLFSALIFLFGCAADSNGGENEAPADDSVMQMRSVSNVENDTSAAMDSVMANLAHHEKIEAQAAMNSSEWPGEYAYAEAYLYNIELKKGLSRGGAIVRDGALNETAVTPGYRLKEKDMKAVQKVIDRFQGTRLFAKCFEPHHGIVWYNAKNRPVGWMSVCFLCDGIRFSPHIKSELEDVDLIKPGSMGKLRAPVRRAFEGLKKAMEKDFGLPVFDEFEDVKAYRKGQRE
ncbi:MAG: hypothetical protein AAF570_01290 [Bacteroidota bacterium]